MMGSQQSQTPAASTIVYLPVAPRTVTPFNGEQYEVVEDWMAQYECVARRNGWTDEHRLHNVHLSLEGTAKHWHENHESSLTSWDIFISELKGTFTNHHRREKAEDLLRARTQGPIESVTGFMEDVLRLSAHADPRVTEEKKL